MSGQWSGEIADVHAKWVDGKVELVWPDNERHLQALADYEAIQALVDEVNQAVIRTEERIIKILEDEFYHYIQYTPVIIKQGEPIPEPIQEHAGDCEGCHLIALIKGEK